MAKSFGGVTKAIANFVKENYPDFEVDEVQIGGMKGKEGHRAMVIIKHKHTK